MKRLIPALLSCCLLFGHTLAQAQYYTVDDNCATAFEDISDTGVGLGLGDDVNVNVSIPFPFVYFNVTSSDVRIGNNGGILFNDLVNPVGFSNTALPNSSGFRLIAPFWDDLDSETGDVYHETRGVAPFRRFIVQWHERPHFPGPGSGNVTFQAIFYETTNEIRFVYADLDFGDPAYDNGVSATVGLQLDYVTAVQYSFNASIAGVTCILFSPVDVAPVCQNVSVQLDANGDAALPDALTFLPQTDLNELPSNGAAINTVFWQSFTPTVSGILDRVTVNVAVITSPSNPQLNIYDGEGDGGALLHSQAIAALAVGANVFDVLASLDLVAGNLYTFRISCSSGNFGLQRNDGNMYAGGISSIGAGTDLIFSTRMLQRPSIDNGSTSPWGIASFTLNDNAFDCTDLGNQNVTLTVTDKLAAVDNCVSVVAVEDNIAPTALCVGGTITVSLDANGDGTLAINLVDNGSVDNCGFTRTLSQSVFDCSHVGTHIITMTVEDIATNTNTCDVNVDVKDQVAPEALCQNLTVVLDANGQGSITPAMVDNGSSDACGIASISLDQEDFNCAHIGTNTVTLTVEDVNGNLSDCTATITVEDNTPPSITCPPSQVLCATDGSGAVVTYANPLGFDNCNFTISQTDVTGLSSGSIFPVGTTTLEYTIVDDGANSQSCTFDITVNAKPVAGFNFSPACEGEAMFFTSTSTIQTGYNIATYSYNMGDGSGPVTQVNPLFIYPASGDYDVTLTVVSTNGCADNITQTVTVTPGPVADFASSTVCLGQQTVFENLTTIDPGYTGNVNYSWNFGDGSPVNMSPDPVHLYATSGTFTVTLTATSENGCISVIQKAVQVSALPQAQFTSSTVCEGVTTLFTDLSFGTGLTYVWDFGDGDISTDQHPEHLYAINGVYATTLTVTAPGDCQSAVTNNVTVIAPPVVDFSFNNVCNGQQVVFENNSASGIYGWNFGDNASSIIADPLHLYAVEGFYDVTLIVTSPQSCTASHTQTVEIYRNPVFTLTPTHVLCFGNSTGSINVLGDQPFALPWEVSLNGAPSQTNVDNFIGLAAGAYTVTVTDVHGCTTAGQTVITQPAAPLSLQQPTLTHLLCNGDNTGALEIQAVGGTAPYLFSLNGGGSQGNGFFGGLSADQYFVSVTDNNGCTLSSDFFEITEPAVLELQLVSFTHLLCNGDSTGSLSVSAIGGTNPYQFNIYGGAFGDSPDFSGLSAGLKNVMVRDANGCEEFLSFTLTEPGILQLSLMNSTPALCSGQATGTINVAAASGTAPYQYSIDGANYQGTGAFLGLAAGLYTLYTRDANNCMVDLVHAISEPTVLTLETTSTPVLCFGGSTGTINIAAAGGVGPYTYSYDDGVNFISQNLVSGRPAGSYITVVRDFNGCTASQGVQVSQAETPVAVSATVLDVLCQGNATGAVTVIGSGGTPTYSYSEDGVVFQSSGLFSGLAAGSYTYTVMDLNGCTTAIPVSVAEPSSSVSIANIVAFDPSCGLATDGSITVVPSGGTPGYTYSSNGGAFQSSQLFANVGVGTYQIVVRDANGCTASEPVELTSSSALAINVQGVVGVVCAGTFTGSIQVTGEGGVPDYTFSLIGGAPQSVGSFSELTNGTYIVLMTDVNGCSVSQSVEVPAEFQIPAVDFSWVIAGEAVWFQNLTVDGDAFLWNFGDGTTSTDVSPVHLYAVPGYYTVTLTATNGCGTRSRTRPVNTINLSIGDDGDKHFSLYPNPASHEVIVTSSRNLNQSIAMQVTSVSGQRMMESNINGMMSNGRMVLDVSGMAQGMYFLGLQTEEGRSVLRFTVTR